MADLKRRGAREGWVRVDVNGALSDRIGVAGLSRTEVDGLAGRVAEVIQSWRAGEAPRETAFLELPARREEARRVLALAKEVREQADTLVVLGIGGSALGARAVLGAIEGERGHRVLVADNIDPWSFGALLEGLDLSRTVFNVISKSGQTVETMAQFLIVRDRLLRALGAVDYKDRVIVTTDPDRGPLRQIVNDEGFRDLEIPTAIGGRFSVLTPVGLFPAAFAGVNILELLDGAGEMAQRACEVDLWRNPAALLASLLYLYETRRGRNVVVLMPYSERLRWFAAWFAQLWAESLGKAVHTDGRPAGCGQTPVVALGATDQHSQLQLYLEGPPDKVVIFVRVEDHGRELEVPPAYRDLEGVGYLGGTRLGALLNIEQRATEIALQKRKRPVVTLSLPMLEANTLGRLFMLFEAATVLAGALHQINPFDQPGVEEGKQLTYGMTGRPGWEQKRREAEEWEAGRKQEYIV